MLSGLNKYIVTILNTESGASLKGAGWQLIGERGGKGWSRTKRPRVDKHPLQKKILFEISI